MTTLYIIGNGFDLSHSLPTSYNDFYRFAKDALDELGWYFNQGDGEPWHDFEKSLGTYNWKSMYEDYNHIDMRRESFKNSDFYVLEDELTNKTQSLVNSLTENFREWICEIDFSKSSRILEFEKSSRFLNFNYTSTLQIVYGVAPSRILHIHGSIEDGSDLIFGHGETMEEEPKYDENGDSTWTLATECENAAKFPFYAFRKPTNDVIKKNRDFFERLDDIERIVVIGHSINDIDLPYFMAIAKIARNANWMLCHHAENEEKHHVEQLTKCGVTRSRIATCKNEDLSEAMTIRRKTGNSVQQLGQQFTAAVHQS